GFSHNVEAKTTKRGQSLIVEDILRVHSVDLVADPATTRGLFESKNPEPASLITSVASLQEQFHQHGAEIAALRTQVEQLQRLESTGLPSRPMSRDQASFDPVPLTDPREFAKAISR